MFIPVQEVRRTGSDGPTDAKIAVIGEAPGAYEERSGKPFQGPAGTVLEQCLHSAGLIRSQIYITNVVNVRPDKNNITPYWTERGGFTELGMEHVERLKREIEGIDADVLVPMGNVPLYALTGLSQITKMRGYPFECTLVPGRTVIPCIHPAAALRGKFIWRYYIMHDLMRSNRYAQDGFTLPKRDMIYSGDFEENVEWIKGHMKQDIVSFDIEVIHYEVSCISFSSKENYAVSIPFYGVWSAEEEVYLWKLVAELLENPNITKIGQNLMFDCSFLALKNRIIVKGPIKDTMIGHSILYPDFEKGLGFLASIYTDVEYWKNMVDFKNIKKEA